MMRCSIFVFIELSIVRGLNETLKYKNLKEEIVLLFIVEMFFFG